MKFTVSWNVIFNILYVLFTMGLLWVINHFVGSTFALLIGFGILLKQGLDIEDRVNATFELTQKTNTRQEGLFSWMNTFRRQKHI
jgi:uncharacterized membrane protein